MVEPHLKYSVVFVVGFVLVAIGFMSVAFTAYQIGLDMSLCENGLSPVPGQGCTYVPYLVIYVLHDSQYLEIGTLAILLGIILLAVYGWHKYMHPYHMQVEGRTS